MVIFNYFHFRQAQAQPEQFLEAFIHETDAKWSFLFNSDRKNTTIDVSYIIKFKSTISTLNFQAETIRICYCDVSSRIIVETKSATVAKIKCTSKCGTLAKRVFSS